MELLRTEDVDIGVQWRVTTEQRNSHTAALATQACCQGKQVAVVKGSWELYEPEGAQSPRSQRDRAPGGAVMLDVGLLGSKLPVAK